MNILILFILLNFKTLIFILLFLKMCFTGKALGILEYIQETVSLRFEKWPLISSEIHPGNEKVTIFHLFLTFILSLCRNKSLCFL